MRLSFRGRKFKITYMDLGERDGSCLDESEEIELHEVPLAEVNDWLARAQAAGRLVDGRVYAGLHFLAQERPNGE